jgi:NADP-dependent 3-hydroxy acid dehydrogenase YdfG
MGQASCYSRAMAHDWSKRVVWITGASSGIGRASAREFARRGAIVALSARRKERLDELAGELESMGAQAMAVVCDVCSEEQQAEAVARIVDRFDRLDVAFANAGFVVGGRVEELTADDWRKQFETNVVAAATTARLALPELQRNAGRLALTGSVAGFFAAPGFAPYHCSKYALRALSRTLSLELHGSGVSVTAVHPGFVASEINQVGNDGRRDPKRLDTRPKALMWSSERAARVIVRAIAQRKRECVFTGHGKLGAWLGTHFPSLGHFMMTRGAMSEQAATFQVDEAPAALDSTKP